MALSYFISIGILLYYFTKKLLNKVFVFRSWRAGSTKSGSLPERKKWSILLFFTILANIQNVFMFVDRKI
jgi:hypothetical protein